MIRCCYAGKRSLNSFAYNPINFTANSLKIVTSILDVLSNIEALKIKLKLGF